MSLLFRRVSDSLFLLLLILILILILILLIVRLGRRNATVFQLEALNEALEGGSVYLDCTIGIKIKSKIKSKSKSERSKRKRKEYARTVRLADSWEGRSRGIVQGLVGP